MPGDPSLAISSGVEPDCVGACPERTFYSSWCPLQLVVSFLVPATYNNSLLAVDQNAQASRG
jgi:hypothetical protein